MTKISGRLPKGDSNGIASMAQAFIADPTRVRVVVALVDCQKITQDIDDDSREPTLRIRRIEAISDRDDQFVMRRLLQREFERRTGRQVLPFDLEETVVAAFGAALGALDDGIDLSDTAGDAGDPRGDGS